MNKQSSILLMVLAVSTVGCELEPPVCGGGRLAEVEFDVEPTNVVTSPVTGELTVTGWADSDRRLAQIRVGSSYATSEADNFATWTAKLSAAELQKYRDGRVATVPVDALDVCGDPYSIEPIIVYVDAPEGSDAPGLTLTVSAGGECYLPADGSALAAIELGGEADAVGVLVNLSAGVSGDFLPQASVRLTADSSGGATVASGEALFRPKAPGKLGILASAGASFEGADPDLPVVAAPVFFGASGTVARDVDLQVGVSTTGRLERCWAEAALPDLVSVSGGGSADLSQQPASFDDPACGQQAVFTVSFATEAPTGASVRVRCEDSYGQASHVDLQVEPN